jgi:hypothetical protein
MVVGMLLYSFVLQLKLISIQIPIYIDYEVIISARPGRGETSGCDDLWSTRDQGSRWGLCPNRASGSKIDGSPFPLGSTATSEPIEIPRSLWGRWRSLDGHRDVITSLWIKKQSNPKQRNINNHQQPLGDKRWADIYFLISKER